MQNKTIITCEHASNRLPEKWAHLFEGAQDVLETHRGWDPGAIQIARVDSDRLGAKLFVFP
jgi:predicted N-formylglutamate amidohydrolase